MKKSILVLIFLFITCLIYPYTPDEVNGFRDLKFGTEFKEFKNLKFVSNFKSVKFYQFINEDLMIEGIKVKKIEYGFYNNKFAVVNITIEGEDNINGILMIFESVYGSPFQDNKLIDSFVWFGDSVLMFYIIESKKQNANMQIVLKDLLKLVR